MMRWRLAWLSVLLCGCVLGAQPAVPVTALWDLDPSHDAPGLTWELERDGVIHPCGSVTVTATERRCSATVPALEGTYRLRGVTATGEAGPWSGSGSGTQTAPGSFTVTWHSDITLTDPTPHRWVPTMSVRFDASTEGLNRTASLPSTGGPFTVMAWFYRTTDQAGPGEILWRYGDASGSNFMQPYLDGADDQLKFWSGSAVTTAGSPLTWSTGAWHHIAVTRGSGGNITLYVDGASYLTASVSAMDSARICIGNSDEYGEWWDGRVGAFKAWTAQLTEAQVAAEMDSYAPVVTSNVNAWCPLQSHSDLADDSGNGYDFSSLGGTLSTEADPPAIGAGGDPEGLLIGGKLIGRGLLGGVLIN